MYDYTDNLVSQNPQPDDGSGKTFVLLAIVIVACIAICIIIT